MTDVLTSEQRQFCMSRICSGNTKPEKTVRKKLWRLGYRYRIKNNLPGHPDIVFPGRRLAIFIDGCFWHRCPIHYNEPKKNAVFWENKISGNVERDIKNNKKIGKMGWQVIRIWEHDINENPEECVERIAKYFQPY